MYAILHPVHGIDIDTPRPFSEGSRKPRSIHRCCLGSNKMTGTSLHLCYFQRGEIIRSRNANETFDSLNDTIRYESELSVPSHLSARHGRCIETKTYETSITRICRLKISSSNLSHSSVSFSCAVFSRRGEGCRYRGRGIRSSK